MLGCGSSGVRAQQLSPERRQNCGACLCTAQPCTMRRMRSSSSSRIFSASAASPVCSRHGRLLSDGQQAVARRHKDAMMPVTHVPLLASIYCCKLSEKSDCKQRATCSSSVCHHVQLLLRTPPYSPSRSSIQCTNQRRANFRGPHLRPGAATVCCCTRLRPPSWSGAAGRAGRRPARA